MVSRVRPIRSNNLPAGGTSQEVRSPCFNQRRFGGRLRPRWPPPPSLVIGFVAAKGRTVRKGRVSHLPTSYSEFNKARSVSYLVTEQMEGQPARTMKVFIIEPDRMRAETTVSMPSDGHSETVIRIFDVRQAKSLQLTPSRQQAELLDLSGTSLENPLKTGRFRHLGHASVDPRFQQDRGRAAGRAGRGWAP